MPTVRLGGSVRTVGTNGTPLSQPVPVEVNVLIVKLPYKANENEADYADRVKAVFKSVHIFIYSDTETDVAQIRKVFTDWRERL